MYMFSAGSTKAEATTTPIQNHVCCGGKRPSLENIAGVFLPSSSSISIPATTSIKDVVFRRKRLPHHGASSTENLAVGTGPSDKLKEYPRSADMLEHNRRSRSEER